MSSPLIVPDDGKISLINRILDGASYLQYSLFKAPTGALGTTFVYGDFTEADFDGYSSQIIYSASWSAATINVDGEAERTSADLTFTCTGSVTPNDIYGYFVHDDYGTVVWASKFAAPVTMDTNGQTIVIPPIFTLKSAY